MMSSSRTLSRFAHFLDQKEHEIRCSAMFLDAWGDSGVPIFHGTGRFKISPSKFITFEMDAKESNEGRALLALRRCFEEPGDRTAALRLRGVDYDGFEWNAGWIRPGYRESHDGISYELFGETMGISTTTTQRVIVSGVELAYSPTPDVPFTEETRHTATQGATEIASRVRGGRHRMMVLGSEIVAMTQPWRDELWICATTSDELNHPYLENWLSEPLRALRGQLIYPRLVARNFSDGRAHVWLRVSPELRRSMGGCASQLGSRSAAEFWRFYGAYLEHVAKHRGPDGDPEFEANNLTRLHDEVIQARRSGSPWVIALSVASAIEGLVKLDPDFAAAPADFTDEQVAAARHVLGQLKPEGLRSRLLSSLGYMSSPSPAKYLSRLHQGGQISKEQLEAWKEVRNRVAHGRLFEPWGTEEENRQLEELVRLFYKLTCHRIAIEPAPQAQI